MDKFYVTTSIPYVNGEPHLGHAMEFIMADVLARYARLQNIPTLFSTGTDEHGGKNAEKAAELKMAPEQFTEQMSQKFIELLKLLNISHDRFIRTTQPEHEKRAQLAWQNLKNYIYKGQYEGWYCVGDEEYFSEQVVKANKGICPEHNRPYERLKEENYFFKLSSFTPKIKAAIETGEFRIVPDSRRNEILSVINAGLEDISISRPKEKIAWGVPVPGDDSQIIYVWFEALLNYITVLGYPDKPDLKKYWPADVQVIGKGILRFHAAIWPGILLGLGLPLPKALYVHGYVTVGGGKMGKSLGNVVSPLEVIQKFGTDAFRYFFVRHIPSYGDGDFNWDRFTAVYNDELADQLGNAVQRTSAMIAKYENSMIGEIPDPEHDIAGYSQAMADFRFDKALEEVWEQVRGLNQYIDETKPWQLADPKTGPRDDEHLSEVLAYIAGCLIEIADLLAPFMPETAAKIKGVFASGVLQPLPSPLFPKQQEPKPASPAA
ncbi:TPA: methionine--tRNA ligase [Candidatus Saccharibacteria bacterium]|nr:MAG: methionyl-tRNA synthetase [Candidatus Saccharibacteria bacterium RIFCSPHIGHO2_12_FULL_47_17]HCM51633.1 methionine--tRNA ligase [Candidatus Saccharibacteria bacterium]